MSPRPAGCEVRGDGVSRMSAAHDDVDEPMEAADAPLDLYPPAGPDSRGFK